MKYDELYKYIIESVDRYSTRKMPVLDGKREVYLWNRQQDILTYGGRQFDYQMADEIFNDTKHTKYSTEMDLCQDFIEENVAAFKRYSVLVFAPNTKDQIMYDYAANEVEDNITILKIREKLKLMFKPFIGVKGRWCSAYETDDGRYLIFEVDTDFYRTQGISDAISQQFNSDEDISNW